ncbi:unnamed protein product [Blepharisma stoltei]|uniref:Cyclic nucleotide-binding domain-containing protein n=1 Tax=Blepharisma stoltei TaxID=1481888 RepID=A0AAU9K3N7_9CILI|nr:unnamed protein product [Blepharisma stoltei]
MSIRLKNFLAGPRLKPGMDQSSTLTNQDIEGYFKKKAKLNMSVTQSIREDLPYGIYHPDNCIKIWYGFFIGLLILYTAIVGPYVVSFLDPHEFDGWFIFDVLVNICFIIDIVWTLNTAFYDVDGILVTERKAIFKNYLKGWLILDVVACIPMGLIPVFNGNSHGYQLGYNRFVRILRLNSLPNLFRLSRLLNTFKISNPNSILSRIQSYLNINHSGTRFLSTISRILVWIHAMACFWHLTSRLAHYHYDTWVVRCGYIDSDTSTLYVTSLYWALTTLTTIGYGDISARTNTEKVLAMFWMIAALYFVSFNISSLSSMFSQIDIKKNQMDQKLALVDEFSNETSLNKNIKRKMQKSIRIKTERLAFTVEEKESLMDELPKQLKYEVATNMHNGAYTLFSFFQNRDQRFIYSIIPFLQPLFASVSETVYCEGEPSNDIFFIVRGRINFVFGDENTVFRVLTKGHYFGDIEIFQKTKRVHTVIAAIECNLLVMMKTVIEKLRDSFPSIWFEMEEMAKEKDKKTKHSIAEMKVLMKANKDGNIKKMTAKEFKVMIEKEMDKFEEVRENEEENIEKVQKKLEEKIDGLSKQIRANTEVIHDIEDILNDMIDEEDKENELMRVKSLPTKSVSSLPLISKYSLDVKKVAKNMDIPDISFSGD